MMEEERLSVKSSTEEEGYTIKLGSKRKLDFEEEDSDEYESYESEDDDDDDEDSEDSDDLMSSETVEVLGNDGVPLTDKDILGCMVGDFRPEPEKIKLLPKIRRYLVRGFKISDCPGQKNWLYGQGCRKSHHAHVHGDQLQFDIFSATWDETTRTFPANVWDNTVDMEVKVGLCTIKSSTEDELLSAYNSGDELSDKWMKEDPFVTCIAENEKSDLLIKISDLSGYSNTRMLNVIKSDQRTANKDIVKLMTKVLTYLRSILQKTIGFKCSDFPGHILDITFLIPRQKIIDQFSRYPEFYDHYTEASECQLGLGHGHGHGHVQTVNLWKETDCCYTYYVTFDVFTKEPKDYNEQSFEAMMHDLKHSIKVIFCRKAASRI
ncbi:hypothetical protein OROMI_022675 [Orobanche minor]